MPTKEEWTPLITSTYATFTFQNDTLPKYVDRLWALLTSASCGNTPFFEPALMLCQTIHGGIKSLIRNHKVSILSDQMKICNYLMDDWRKRNFKGYPITLKEQLYIYYEHLMTILTTESKLLLYTDTHDESRHKRVYNSLIGKTNP